MLKGKTIEIPEGVAVKNETGNEIEVNYKPLANGETITVKNPEPESPTDKPSTDDKKTESSKTGDNIMVMGYVVTMLATLVIGGILVISKKKIN